MTEENLAQVARDHIVNSGVLPELAEFIVIVHAEMKESMASHNMSGWKEAALLAAAFDAIQEDVKLEAESLYWGDE